MIPIILDLQFNRKGMIDDYISFIWTSRYNKCGDFELVVPMSEKNRSLLLKDCFVIREDDSNVGIIETIKYIKVLDYSDSKEQIVVTGRFTSALVSRRIIAKQTQLNNKRIPEIIQILLNRNLINPAQTIRKINHFSFNNSTTCTASLSVQYTGQNLLETIENLCEEYDLGFRTILENGNHKFVLYQGKDRSINQNVNARIVFSQDYDNLEGIEYEENCTSRVTDVLVAGEGEGADRITEWAYSGTDKTDFRRYEVYQDARNARKEYEDDNGNKVTLSDSAYRSQLRAEGKQSLSSWTKAIISQLFFDNYKYKEDVNLGDIVTVEVPEWGISADVRLIEMIESVSETGEYTMTPTFAESEG